MSFACALKLNGIPESRLAKYATVVGSLQKCA
jgi:hypothetical protein